MHQDWRWTPEGEIECDECGARYAVEAARIDRRRYDYLRCESCHAVMDEWIDRVEKRQTRLDASAASLPAAAGAVAAARR